MTGKEALEQYKKIYVDKVIMGDVPTEDWLLKKINEDLEELERWRKGEFILVPARKMGKTPYYVLAAKVLDKYVKAFEIFKRLINDEFTYVDLENGVFDGTIDITEEEVELLEELMSDAKD